MAEAVQEAEEEILEVAEAALEVVEVISEVVEAVEVVEVLLEVDGAEEEVLAETPKLSNPSTTSRPNMRLRSPIRILFLGSKSC